MLTPVFELCQDGNFITITIKTPFAKVSETEIFIEDCEFKFYSKPYYLRLNLPGSIVEDGREKAEYKAETGEFTIRVAKATPGQYFDGLDMLTKLLAPSGRTSTAAPLIETLGGAECQDEDEEFDWQIEQNVCDEEVLLKGPRYGFANQRSGILKKLQAEIPDMIDLPDADSVARKDRTDLRLADELQHFDDDYYIADLYDDEAVQSLLDFQPWWQEVYKKAKSGAAPEDLLVFTNSEREKMKLLPRKEYVLDKRDECTALLGLVDIVFAYAYGHRTTEGENTVESGWTIRKLSATLSWLEVYSRPEEVVTACYRRCLAYPLYRHWKLTARVYRDVRHIFTAGRRCLLRCLLDIHSLMMDGDSRYILNDLYITDYCVWIQQVSEKKLSSLASKLTQVKITKGDVDFELGLLERAAYLAVEEQREAANQIVDGVAAMTVTSANQITDDVAAMTVTSANQVVDDVAAMTVASANRITDDVADMTVTSANTTRASECQKDTETKNGDIAALTTQLQINEGSGETVKKVAPCEGDTQQNIPEHSSISRDTIPELSTITDNTPELSTVVNDDLVQNIDISKDTTSHLGASEVTSCEQGCGLIKEISHDAVESQSSSGSESESSESDSSEESDSTSDVNTADSNLARRKDTGSDKQEEMKDSQTTQINDKTSLNF